MKEKSPQTFDDTPPIPKFTIAKKKTEKPKQVEAEVSSRPKPIERKAKAISKQVDVAAIEKTIYDGYSTQLRTDIQKQLKRLKRNREEARHSVCTIKQFFELAILDQFAAKKGINQGPNGEGANEVDFFYTPFRTEIRRDLMRRIKRWKYEQEVKGEKGASIKSFLEEAIITWLSSLE